MFRSLRKSKFSQLKSEFEIEEEACHFTVQHNLATMVMTSTSTRMTAFSQHIPEQRIEEGETGRIIARQEATGVCEAIEIDVNDYSNIKGYFNECAEIHENGHSIDYSVNDCVQQREALSRSSSTEVWPLDALLHENISTHFSQAENEDEENDHHKQSKIYISSNDFSVAVARHQSSNSMTSDCTMDMQDICKSENYEPRTRSPYELSNADTVDSMER